jgi:hypothetical protein
MWPFRKKEKVEGVTCEPLDKNAGYKLDIQGSKFVALKLPLSSVWEIAGGVKLDAMHGTEVGGSGKFASETGYKWALITNQQNPLIRDLDNLLVLASKALTNTSGSTISARNIVVSGTTPVTYHVEVVDSVSIGEDKINAKVIKKSNDNLPRA